MNYLSKGLSLITVLMLMTLTVSAQNQEQQEIYQQYMGIQQQLQQIQQQALADEEIKEMTEKFSEKVETAIVDENPELKSTIEKKDKLVDQYEKAQENDNQEKVQEIQASFKEVSEKLQPVQQEIMQKEEFSNKADEIDTAVREKMEEINPETPQLIAKMNELGQKLQAMQQK